MALLFMTCAVVGGTVLICQFVLTLVGLSGDHGIDFGHDASTDFSGGTEHDASGGDAHGADQSGHDAQHHNAQYQGTSWLFAVVSFRTLVAAITFFGLVGMAARSAEQSLGVQLLLATAAGIGAMYGVHWLIRTIGRLGEDATLRVKNALGQEGTVYVPIAAARAQAGKIQLKVQNRLVEYEAVTAAAERLPTGAKVRVVGVTGNVLEVEPVKKDEPVSSSRSHVPS